MSIMTNSFVCVSGNVTYSSDILIVPISCCGESFTDVSIAARVMEIHFGVENDEYKLISLL